MSAQTDCEMLSIEVMEAYAGKYNLSGSKVAELFHKNQVLEKMLIQHEYLHQVSFEEVMEFVENVVADDNTMETVQLYMANILTATEAVERLRYNNVNNQVSFHTEKALQYLKLVGRSSYARKDI